MPNDCYNTLTIGASEDVINMLVENEFLFDKLRPLGETDIDTRIKFWGTKWERTDYEVIKRGLSGLQIKFNTDWNPPYKLFEYLIETHDIWLKCVWSEEGGRAGTYVGKKGEEALNVIWDDWCLEEWAVRMA